MGLLVSQMTPSVCTRRRLGADTQLESKAEIDHGQLPIDSLASASQLVCVIQRTIVHERLKH